MKKSIKWLALVSLLLIVVMSFALVSCGGGNDDTDSNVDTNTDTNVEEKSYTITFKQADGTEEKVTVKAGEAVNAPAAIQVDGYTVAWDVTDFSNVTADMTVNAVKTAIEYTITYEVGDGTNDPANAKKYKISANDIILKAAAAVEGLEFEGWYTDSSFAEGTKIEKIAAGTFGDITLYARYQFERYDITYELNGGRNNSNNPKDFNKTESVSLLAPKKNGYEFKGWFTDMDFTEGITNIPKNSNSPVTVYAKWEIITYNLEYVVGDKGTIENLNIPTEYTVETTFEIADPTIAVPGYKFEGWYLDSDFEEAFTNFETGKTKIEKGTMELSDTNKLYAKYSAIEYLITYENNGGTNSNDNPVSYTVENVGDDKLVLVAATRKGYNFGGWYLDEKFEGTAVTEIDATKVGGVTLYAKWDIITYNITYVLDGGTNAAENVATYTAESNVTFAAPTKADTYLMGWYTDAEFTKSIKSTEGLAEDITVYAKWFYSWREPTLKVEDLASKIESINANEENTRKDTVSTLYDGSTEAAGIWGSDPKVDWYGAVGDTVTIVFKEEISIKQLKVFASGNSTNSKYCLYDVDGNLIKENAICADNSGSNGSWLTAFDLDEAVKVKTLVIEVTALKWDNPRTHRIAEIEIYSGNPDYNPNYVPEA